MRKEIWRILKDLENEKVTTNEAYHLLCDLFAVSGRSEQLCDFLEWYDEKLTLEEREMDIKTYLDMKSHNCR